MEIDLWKKIITPFKYSEFKKLNGNYKISIPIDMTSKDKCKLEFTYPNKIMKGHMNINVIKDFNISVDAGGCSVNFPIAKIIEIGQKEKISFNSKVSVTLHYVAKV